MIIFAIFFTVDRGHNLHDLHIGRTSNGKKSCEYTHMHWAIVEFEELLVIIDVSVKNAASNHQLYFRFLVTGKMICHYET